MAFSRGRHGATLTPVGERVVRHAQDMLRSLENLGKEAALGRGLQAGEVRIATFRSAATHLLPQVIAQFRAAHPGISVTLSEFRGQGGIEQALHDGRADIGFAFVPLSAEFEVWEIARDEYVVLLPPHVPVGRMLSWADLAQFPLILYPDNDFCAAPIHHHLIQYGQPVQIAYEIVEASTIIGMVRQGLGATIMPRLAAEPLPPDVQVLSLPVPLERIIRVAILSKAMHPPAVYAFLDSLKAASLTQSSGDTLYVDRRDQATPTAIASCSGEVRQL